jgi:GntR family transcriptional regulator
VRSLSTTLKINPNTAHKVIVRLTGEGLLEVKPGIGTILAASVPEDPHGRNNLLKRDLERVVVEARHLGIEWDDLTAALSYHWTRLSPAATDER